MLYTIQYAVEQKRFFNKIVVYYIIDLYRMLFSTKSIYIEYSDTYIHIKKTGRIQKDSIDNKENNNTKVKTCNTIHHQKNELYWCYICNIYLFIQQYTQK